MNDQFPNSGIRYDSTTLTSRNSMVLSIPVFGGPIADVPLQMPGSLVEIRDTESRLYKASATEWIPLISTVTTALPIAPLSVPLLVNATGADITVASLLAGPGITLTNGGSFIQIASSAAPPTPGVGSFADFFALMPGDNAATIALGAPVLFPQDGPASGGVITRASAGTFQLANVGTYEVSWQVSVTEAGQLVLALGGLEQATTVVGRATGTSQISGTCMITTVAPNTILSLVNPAGNATALTITPNAGGASAVSAHLVIKMVA